MKKDLLKEVEFISSREIAELTEKQHSHVMRDIREVQKSLKDADERTLESMLGGKSTFGLTKYKDAQNKNRDEYNLTKKQTLLVVSGYNVVLRAKIINRWEELERENEKLKDMQRQDVESRNYCRYLYRPMSDALKEHRLELGKETKFFHYSNEAEMINRIIFGESSKEWRDSNPDDAKIGNQRDFATIEQKKLLAKLEDLNKAYLDTGFEFEVRKGMLTQYVSKKRKLL